MPGVKISEIESNRLIFMGDNIKLAVLSDLAPGKPFEIERGRNELPNKYFVDYINKLKAEDPSIASDRNPYSAARYNSLAALNNCELPQPFDLNDNIHANGFRPQSKPEDPLMVLFFKVQAPPG